MKLDFNKLKIYFVTQIAFNSDDLTPSFPGAHLVMSADIFGCHE